MESNPKPNANRHTPNLERDKMLTAALEVLNEVGFEGLTQRKLADKLGVKAAALYWHFKNKQDLIDQLAARIISEETGKRRIPDDATWRDIFTTVAYATRDALRRYRDGALVIARADMSKSDSGKSREAIMVRLFALDFPADLASTAFFAVARYTLGCVLEEQADPVPLEQRARAALAKLPELVEKYPTLTKAFQRSYDTSLLADPDKQFEAGLAIILDGIEARLKHRS